MNGETNDSTPTPSSYLRTGSTPSSYSISPRLRRLDEMKKSYSASSNGTGGYTSNGSTTIGGYSTPQAGQGYSSSYGAKYRLASLDRLAHRHKLYETNGSETAPPTVPANGTTNGTSNGTAGVTNSVGTTQNSNGSATTVIGNSQIGIGTIQSSIGASQSSLGTTPSSIGNNQSSIGITTPIRIGTTPSGISTSPSGIVSPRSTTTTFTNGLTKESGIATNGTIISTRSSTSTLPVLQSKREMFFKADGTGPGTGVTQPNTAPPAPPITSPATAPPAPPSATSTPPTSTITTTSTTSVASIKEQLLTTKERKEHKEEENKENKMAKELVKERKPREVDGYVGFANLPNQVYRKAVKRGFEFSLMVVGESGLGKSTMINSMFLSDVYSADHPGPSHRVKKTVQVETTKVLLKENGVNLLLTVTDTPGFGDAVDNSDCWQPVIDHIETKYEEYLNAESRVSRKKVIDNRIHCCLYFIAPSGHGLKPLDIEFMRRLHDKVNIIPVISKADTLTPDECQHLKRQILNEIAQHKIKIYEFPDDDGDHSTNKLKQRVPFAVVGSNATIEVDGKKLRGRKYPWGLVEVENMEHCDFIPLRNMMIRTHMQDLKDVTNNVHYENFRCRKLAGIGGVEGKLKLSNKNPLAQMEEEKKEHSNRMKKMEAEMEQVFEMKVKEKMNKLSELENDLKKRNENMKKKLESEFKQLEEEREHFDQEKKVWENATGCSLEELRRKNLESSSREHMDQKEKTKKKKGLF